jgi:hypothetical protein
MSSVYQCNLVSENHIRVHMVGFDPLAFPLIGFPMTYIALEGAWHFAVGRINNGDLVPCIFKQARMLVARL